MLDKNFTDDRRSDLVTAVRFHFERISLAAGSMPEFVLEALVARVKQLDDDVAPFVPSGTSEPSVAPATSRRHHDPNDPVNGAPVKPGVPWTDEEVAALRRRVELMKSDRIHPGPNGFAKYRDEFGGRTGRQIYRKFSQISEADRRKRKSTRRKISSGDRWTDDDDLLLLGKREELGREPTDGELAVMVRDHFPGRSIGALRNRISYLDRKSN